MKRKVQVVVETGKDLFSCFTTGIDDLDFGINGTGKTVRKAIKDFYEAVDEMKGLYDSSGRKFPELEFEFIFDVGAFFNYYSLNITAFAEYAGINASLLRQYACGLRTPKEKSLEKIRSAIKKVTHDIDAGLLIDRPVPQYV